MGLAVDWGSSTTSVWVADITDPLPEGRQRILAGPGRVLAQSYKVAIQVKLANTIPGHPKALYV